jgi:FK506-binding protein 2
MRLSAISAIIAIALPFVHGEVQKPLDIQITHAVECERKSQAGDSIEVHYKGTLLDGSSMIPLLTYS